MTVLLKLDAESTESIVMKAYGGERQTAREEKEEEEKFFCIRTNLYKLTFLNFNLPPLFVSEYMFAVFFS